MNNPEHSFALIHVLLIKIFNTSYFHMFDKFVKNLGR